ncbi:EF-hand domain-containing protein [Mesobacterium sp. TK19101]|uniref:EF-hand domain-containing protein n=1 Tax=Mesobacterium hydrothermale TaxID=3111907 RepID=A0ABU6HGC8_9RHOB|nr:EF-hand domain-containing protein [Mesobacterium sp. TK19101]MEC3861514.1 EF-hand domain-containing protein [Mesobacterium sp. TK19101]
MIRPLAITALVLSTGMAFAQQGNPGGHFVENWDLNGDGQVTLEEATERRGDVFTTFDSDENGILTAEEYDLFDEARANDMENNGMGHGNGGGQGQGQGKGQGQGGGQGHGHGAADGMRNPANGMLREFTDANGDGEVTRDEFIASVPVWFENMDRNGDGVVTVADFGRN